MFTSKTNAIIVGAAFTVMGIAGYVSFATGAPTTLDVFTKLGTVVSMFPRNLSFSAGTTTPSVARLSSYANAGENVNRLFEVGSSTSSGTAKNFLVDKAGCIQMVATTTSGTPTPVKLILSTTGATSSFSGTAYWQYGSCL